MIYSNEVVLCIGAPLLLDASDSIVTTRVQLQGLKFFRGLLSKHIHTTIGDTIRDERSASLNHDCAERPDVTLHRVSAMEEQRRARPCRSSDLGEGVCWHAVQHFSQAKVRNLASPLSGQQNVGALQIQMTDILLVQRQQARSNVLDDLFAPVQHLTQIIHNNGPNQVSR